MVDAITGMTAWRHSAGPAPRRWQEVGSHSFAAAMAGLRPLTGPARSIADSAGDPKISEPAVVPSEIRTEAAEQARSAPETVATAAAEPAPADSTGAGESQPAGSAVDYANWRQLGVFGRAPTAELLFGPDPWLENPTQKLPSGMAMGFNPIYFAKPETAAKLAEMLGGTVVERNAMTGDQSLIMQQQPNQMVLMPNGALINAGLAADVFNHGYSQEYVDWTFEQWINPTTEA